MNSINVLSLFDGISAGMVALERSDIPVNKYYASEIDKNAIKISNKNYPNIVQLGSIENWEEWNLDDVDLIIGGSPCQGFSKSGLGLSFNDPRSKLFFKFIEILNFWKIKKPGVKFLLENVVMKKEWEQIITNLTGVQPVLINSKKVSAQNRERLYWTNINRLNDVSENNIYMCDLIENNPKNVKYGQYNNKGYDNVINFENNPIDVGRVSDIKGIDMIKRVYHINGKSPTLTAVCGGIKKRKLQLIQPPIGLFRQSNMKGFKHFLIITQKELQELTDIMQSEIRGR